MKKSVYSQDELLSFLSSIEFFQHLKKSALKSLIANLEVLHLKGREALIWQGSEDNDMFVVLQGRLRVFRNFGEEKEEILDELGVGQVVGEVAILADRPRTATVIAIRDSVLLKLSKLHYDQFVNEHPEAGLNIAKGCIERLLNVGKKEKPQVRTVTFLPLQDSPRSQKLIEKIASRLESEGKTFFLTRKLMENLVGDISNIFNNIEQLDKALRFLNAQEKKYRYVLYIADPKYTPWTELAARQADSIYMIKESGKNEAEAEEIENHFLREKKIGSRITLILHHHNKLDEFSDAYAWIRQEAIKDYYHVNHEKAGDIERVVRFITGKSVGLVLSGGGARGLAHIGVIRALEQLKIPIDIVGGSSMGAVVAGLYGMGYGSHEIERLCYEYIHSVSRLDLTFPYISLMKGNRLTQLLNQIFADKFIEELQRRMFCVSTNITKNEVVIHDKGLLKKALRASISLPGIYPPVFEGTNLLVDGSVLNNLPVELMLRRFYAGKVIASCVLMSNDRYQTRLSTESLSGWRILLNKLNPFSKKMEVPRIDTILMRSITLNEIRYQIDQAKLADFSLFLDLSRYGLMDFKQFPKVIEDGFLQATEKMKTFNFDEWKEESE